MLKCFFDLFELDSPINTSLQRNELCMSVTLRTLTRFVPLLLTFVLNWNAFAVDPIVEKSFSAYGSNEFVIDIKKWGRYAIEAKSPNGTMVELFNKKTGFITRAGIIGEKDGRVDVLLDKGEIKIRSTSPQKGKGNLAVKVYQFKGAESETYLELPLQKLDSTQCRDFQQVSWWISVPNDTLIFLEVQGRQIADVALYQSGTWKVDCQRREFVNMVQPEKPLKGFRVITNLKKGNYLVTAYGGSSNSWSVKSASYPVFVQYGLTVLGRSAEYRFTIPPSGIARYAVSNGTQAVILETASKDTTQLDLHSMRGQSDLYSISSGSIIPTSSSPRAILRNNGNEAVVSVSGAPGQSFKLTMMGSMATSVSVSDDGKYLLSTLTTGKPDDLIGVSGFIYDRTDGRIIAMQADTVSGSKQIRKKFNLMDNVRTYLWVEEDGNYTFETDKGIEYRITRFYAVNTPSDNPVLIHNGIATESLKKGLYTLLINPQKKGYCAFAVTKTLIGGGLAASIKKTIGLDNFKAHPPKLYWQIPQIFLPSTAVIQLNSQTPELSEIVLKRLLQVLDVPLTLYCQAGERIDLAVDFTSERILTYATQGGKNVKIMVDNGAYNASAVSPGKHTVSVVNNSAAVSRVLLSALSPKSLSSEKMMVSYDDPVPVISTEKPVFFDIGTSDRVDYQFSIATPGIYRVETGGRLATGIRMRDRLLLFVQDAREKGVGRNAIFVDYLLPGQYMISVSSEGSSAGRMSLSVKRNDLLSGGLLDNTIEKRSLVPAYTGIMYEINPDVKGEYVIKSFGRNVTFPVRIEDCDGWPLLRHGVSSPISVTLEKGTYRLLSLPVSYEARRIAKLSLTSNKPALSGRGPHILTLNESLSAHWKPSGKGDTIPVVFECSIPATIDASLVVSPEFKATMRKKGSSEDVVSWSGKKSMRIASGEYLIRVVPVKNWLKHTYNISISTRDLVPGCHYTLEKQKTLRVQVDKKGVYEFFSQGMMDVSGKLLAENAKTVVAHNDDGFLDWNFSISKILDTGRYFIKIISEETSFSGTEIFMKAVRDTVFPALKFDNSGRASSSVDMKGNVVVFPVSRDDKADVFSVDIQGQSRLAGVVERKSAKGWVSVGESHSEKFRISVPMIKGQAYRLKLWSEDHINENVEFQARILEAKRVTIDEMVRGTNFNAEKGNNFTAYYCIDMEKKGAAHFNVESDKGFLTSVTSTDDSTKSFFEEKGQFVSVNRSKMYVEIFCGKQGGQKVKFSPIMINDREPVSVQMYKSKARTYDIESKKDVLSIVSITMNPGQPLAGVVSSNGKNIIWNHNGQSVRNGQYFDDNFCAVACFQDDVRKVTLWNASGSDISFATVKGTSYRISDGGVLPSSFLVWGNTEQEAVAYRFPDTESRFIQVILPPGCGVLYRSINDDRQCIISGDAVRNVSITGSGGGLYLFRNNKKVVIKADIFLNKNARENGGVLSGKSFSRQFSSGKTIVPVNGVQKGKQWLYWSGAVDDVRWINGEGKLRTSLKNGSTIENVSGHLMVISDGGWGKVGLCNPGNSYGEKILNFWESGNKPEKPFDIHSSVRVALHDGINWFKISLKDTSHVNLAAQTALSAFLMKESSGIQFQDSWDAFNWDIPLSGGTWFLGLKGLAGKALENVEFSVAFKKIVLLSEKHPWSGFIGPGECRMAKFSIVRKKKYGIGIAMKNETVESKLLNSKLETVTAGKQHYISLVPGTYYLSFSVPESSEGTELTTYLFGQDSPPNEPPGYLVRWLIQGAEGDRPTSDPANRYNAPQIQWNDNQYNSENNYSSGRYNNEGQENESDEYEEEYSDESDSDENYDESGESEEGTYNDEE